MNWIKLAVKLPMVASGIYDIVAKIKGATHEQKKDAVIEAIPSSISLAEFTVDKDFLNDAAISKLLSALLDAEAIVAKAREAFKDGILNKAKEELAKPPTP